MITIEYDSKTAKFLIKCGYQENGIVAGLPDRRFRKASGVWAAPALKRNIQYMEQNMSSPQLYSKEALAVFNEKRAEVKKKPTGNVGFPAWYDFKNPPMKHQKVGLEKFFPLDEAGILFEQGLGKTFTAINLTAAWRMTDAIDSVVVICPSSIKLVWEKELNEHCPIPTQRHVIKSGKVKATERFIEEREEFQWLVVGVEGLSQGGAYELVKRFMAGRRVAVIIDESSRIKTPNKTRTDRCISLGQLAKKRLILSGTSVTQGIEDLYTQFKFLNPDITGYDSFYSFRAQYCQTITMEIGKGRFITKIVGYQNEDELIESISPYILRVEKKDALDLPEKIFTERVVTMAPKQAKLYKQMFEELFTEVDDIEYEVDTILEQALRLQQITGGHYPHDDGEQVVATPIEGKNPKLEELMDILDEVSGKVVVWCQFRSEIALVAERMRKAGIEFVEFHGGCDDTEKSHAVNSFTDDGSVKVFLATRAAAYGLTLVSASTAIYYSQNFSLEDDQQSQDRIHRIGQKDSCNYIYLVCDGSIDLKIRAALHAKTNVATMIYSLMKQRN